MIQMLIDDPAMGEYDMSSLRNILYGGSPISEALLDARHAVVARSPVHSGLRHDRGLRPWSVCYGIRITTAVC